jgi:deazaflavin-dependent oxidoreductase (nitroreductase family)
VLSKVRPDHDDPEETTTMTDTTTSSTTTTPPPAESTGHRGDAPRYAAPGSFTTRVFNPFVAWLTRRGVSVMGSRVLEVRGRSSGAWRSTPVNLLTVDDVAYLVAPRGTTHWVRNLRVAGEGRLRVGRRSTRFTAAEVPDDDKPAILRAYLTRWKWEVGAFFDGVGPDAHDEELRAIADGYPVFRVELH